jgi:hypothetical protein
MSEPGKVRLVYQERVAHRQAVERLRRVYAKLCQSETLETNKSNLKPLSQSIQEDQK